MLYCSVNVCFTKVYPITKWHSVTVFLPLLYLLMVVRSKMFLKLDLTILRLFVAGVLLVFRLLMWIAMNASETIKSSDLVPRHFIAWPQLLLPEYLPSLSITLLINLAGSCSLKADCQLVTRSNKLILFQFLEQLCNIQRLLKQNTMPNRIIQELFQPTWHW
jgi:hypothetical protein